MKRFLLAVCCFFIVVAGFISIAGQSLAQRDRTVAGAVTDHASLVANLQAVGVNVEPAGEVDQPFFSAKGKVIQFYGDHVQVFEYANAAAAEAEASLVSPNGMGVGNRRIHWLGPPHFYKKEKLIVLYVGDDAKVLKVLETLLGGQFAGQ